MSQPTNYTQGYSRSTLSSHASRTVASDASFLVPYIKPTDKILDVGCGPGTITVGSVIGIDISDSVLKVASELVQKLQSENKLKGPVSLQQADLLRGLPFEDDTFDIVYARTLKEMRRVLKPGGIVATRDAAAQHFFPKSLDLENLLTKNMIKGIGLEEWPGPTMVALYRQVGFDVDGGKVKVGSGTSCHADAESRHWWADGLSGRLQKGDPFRASWIEAGIEEKTIDECVARLKEWAETQDAWYGMLQSEIVAWK
ncbi:S-adenosyl-L-methionine-dependent methyltransferase [Gymnopilus junonius]|uniref:S-adenosyl-L-methionine-dependent methyltransferase n=1 Tax=Gymnopilus junonius TaxID=109634 RepID=A0A9P5NYN2_GYMJU|nr:S-adenosyl-L-methionine-dependent methyltransferase [Gymnopilus junonius]